MKSMIFAAGLGTRLRPLTNDRPKALVEVKGKPLLQYSIEALIKAGSTEIIINVHHFADLIENFLTKKNNFGIRIEISDEREKVLETGGGLKKAQWFFNDGAPFLLCNVDVLTNMDLKAFYNAHPPSGTLATLAVRNRPSSRYLLFDKNNRLIGWENVTNHTRQSLPQSRMPQKKNIQHLAFSGIHVLSPRIFEYMPPEDKFSIIEVYLRAMDKETIRAYPHDTDNWLDVGRPESLMEAEKQVNGD
ncbi:MAG TPA: nucleotidyltransferase family protein [Bacteroidetes bacterium]|nr:nucleotidyltransferase family protein [Bacteroidota bacterium]